MKSVFGALLSCSMLLTACTPIDKDTQLAATQDDKTLSVYGHWIIEPDGTVMPDPQPSGLVR